MDSPHARRCAILLPLIAASLPLALPEMSLPHLAFRFVVIVSFLTKMNAQRAPRKPALRHFWKEIRWRTLSLIGTEVRRSPDACAMMIASNSETKVYLSAATAYLLFRYSCRYQP